VVDDGELALPDEALEKFEFLHVVPRFVSARGGRALSSARGPHAGFLRQGS
jgi:hypothetical protein